MDAGAPQPRMGFAAAAQDTGTLRDIDETFRVERRMAVMDVNRTHPDSIYGHKVRVQGGELPGPRNNIRMGLSRAETLEHDESFIHY